MASFEEDTEEMILMDYMLNMSDGDESQEGENEQEEERREKNIMYKRGIKDAMKSFAGIDLGDFSDGTRGRMEDGIFAEAVRGSVCVLNVLCSL